MSNLISSRIISHSPEDTVNFAATIAKDLTGGEVIELEGDMGSGKTTFVKGLAKGLGIKALVNSPSFTLSNQYKSKYFTLFHYDFHRLVQAGIMKNELTEALSNPQNIVVVEWSNLFTDVLPENRTRISIKVLAENSREFKITKTVENIAEA